MSYTIEPKIGKEYDVVICGAGTAGVIAAIAAGRQGASVLLVERSFHVGGMLTDGNAGITKFTEHCKDLEKYNREIVDVLSTDPRSVQVAGGIAHELCMRLINSGGATGTNGECGSYIFTERYAAETMILDMLAEAKVDILYDSRVCLAGVEGDILKRIVVANKSGFVEYSAKCFIDSTGDADLAALSGVEYALGASERDIAEGGVSAIGQVQPCGTMYRIDGVDYQKLFDYLEKNPHLYNVQSVSQQTLSEARRKYYAGEMVCFCIMITNPNPLVVAKVPMAAVQIYVEPSHKGAIVLCYPGGERTNAYMGNGVDAESLSAGQTELVYGALRITEILRNEYPEGFGEARVVQVPDIGVRESRHIVGKYMMTAFDVISGREFEDSIGGGGHHIDSNYVPAEIRAMSMDHWRFHIPYSIMLPEKIKNLLVAGRSASATRLASGAIRVTVACMEMGEAAGVAAAMAAKEGISPDEIDVKAMQSVLLEGGAIL